MSDKAIVFTHLDERDRLADPNRFDDFEERRISFFKHCLQCPNIGVVFVYSSYGIQAYIDALLAGNGGAIPLEVLDGEQRIYDALQLVVDHAAAEIAKNNRGFRRSHGPKFVFVGVRELACHLSRLHRTDEHLVRSLAAGDRFTYDSPKYVEAIIRIARSHEYPGETIVRIDADVEVNEEAIARLMQEADDRRKAHTPIFWFSGTYKGTFAGDSVNEHAVRQHWLVDPDTWHDPHSFRLIPGAESFLVDLAELGATQVVPSVPPHLSVHGETRNDPKHDPRLTPAARALIDRRGASKNRGKPQVISGAGLVASPAAILRLPPFTNARSMVVWIDDHLKRLLHEAIGDISPGRVERLMDAAFRQDRYPVRLTQRDVDWAKNVYFKRLLAGCMMEATIKTSKGGPGPLAECVAKTLDHQAFSKPEEEDLRLQLVEAACTRFKEVMSVWRNADYGNAILRHWAEAFNECDALAADVADIGISYVHLCIDWPKHTNAMWTLGPQEAYWLFALPREAPPRAKIVVAKEAPAAAPSR